MTASADDQLVALMRELRDRLALSRATLRLDVPDDVPMPMTHEELAPGVASVRGKVVPAAGSPTVTVIMRDRGLVIVEDCARAAEDDATFDDDGFRSMVRDYGGLGAFIAAPVFDGEQLVAILSLHHLGSPRRWASKELEIVLAARDRIAELRALYAAEHAAARPRAGGEGGAPCTD